jgi:hypothetical protein
MTWRKRTTLLCVSRRQQPSRVWAQFGRIRSLELRTPRNPPGYAFIEYEEPRAAEDAVRARDNYDFYGHHLRVGVLEGFDCVWGASPYDRVWDSFDCSSIGTSLYPISPGGLMELLVVLVS